MMDEQEILEMVDDAIVGIMEGLLVWMDMAEELIESGVHHEECDGDCSPTAVDILFALKTTHINEVIDSFRKSLDGAVKLKDELTSDASKEIDNE